MRRSEVPKSVNSRSAKQSIIDRIPRKMVFVKNAIPIHINKRDVKIFNPGDSAWISWDGRKATPVTVLEVDDCN